MTRPESSPCALCGKRQPMLLSYPLEVPGAFLPQSLAMCDAHFAMAERGELRSSDVAKPTTKFAGAAG